METAAPAIAVSRSLHNSLYSASLREILSVLGHASELRNLESTVATVTAVFLDAETRNDPGISMAARDWLQMLKDAVYNVDDEVDKFVTLADCIKKKSLKEGTYSVVYGKTRYLFYLIKNLPAAFTMSEMFKRIRRNLDCIARDHAQVGFGLSFEPIRRKRQESCSYVYPKGIIGREDDKEKIVKMLQDSNATRDVSFLTIVGIGGIGKTALAQLLFNDDMIKSLFSLRMWVSIADEDPNHLNLKMVLHKIFGSCFDRPNEELSLEFLQKKVREHLSNNKYFLVLDDMWNENPQHWHALQVFLKGSAPGSWVVMTTRSSQTAAVVEGGLTYYLKGLSEKDSLHLFEMVALGGDGSQSNPPDLVKIGKSLVKQCAYVPLSIRVIGSILYGQPRQKWLSFRVDELLYGRNDISPLLNLGYQQLDSLLKSCFIYCALFPKDFEIDVKVLIRLWMAQGYIVPAEEAQSMEDAALEYLTVLLQRSFFQVVKKDESGDIVSVKLEGLMHDLAQQVAKEEVCRVDYFKSDLEKKIRHLSVAKGMSIDREESWTSHSIRTLFLLYGQMEGLSLQILSKNCKSLRALDLRSSGIYILPDEIGTLLHLRYLDLSSNIFTFLPKSFTKLHNLETLNLSGCASLKKLPDDIWKLVKLRYLDIQGCKRMTHMPASIGMLRCLRTLTMFVVDLSHPHCSNLLEGAKFLQNVGGRFEIRIHGCENASLKGENNWGGECLINKKYVKEIVISFPRKGGGKEYQEKLMEAMQPNENLKKLELKWYKGERFPSWGRGDDNLAISLPNLVEIQLYHCEEVQYLPCMAQLSCLKRLTIDSLPNLKYMEKNRNRNSGRVGTMLEISETAEESCFFRCLEVLVLQQLKRLKGWWREEDGEGNGVVGDRDNTLLYQVQHFPRLLTLKVGRCPELTFLPGVPNAKEVALIEVNDMLRVSVNMNEQREGSPSLKMEVDSLRYLKGAMPLQRLTTLVVEFDNKVESLEDLREIWLSCCSSLQVLKVLSCDNLKSVGRGGLEHLTALKSLQISNCSGLTFTEEGGNREAVLSSSSSFPFPQSLRSLDLSFLRKMEKLPEGMQNLTSLESLSISNCKALVSLPEWIHHLTSHPRLEIRQCSEELHRSFPGEAWSRQSISYRSFN